MSDDTDSEFVQAMHALGWVMLLSVPYALFRGWAISMMWGWFVVPLLRLPQLPVAAAAGLCCIYGVVASLGITSSTGAGTGKHPFEATVIHVVSNLLILATAYVIHLVAQ